MRRSLAALSLALLLAGTAAAPARAQWTRVGQVPAGYVWSVSARGDTVVAGTDTLVHVSTDGGAAWTTSARVGSEAATVEAVRVHAGRLYAGTYGQGVYASDDLGATFVPASAGLAGGLFDSHLYITDFAVRDGRLFASTDGAGVFAFGLVTPGQWAPFFQSGLTGSAYGSVVDLEAAGGRMLAAGGANGVVARNDAAGTGWQLGYLDNTGLWPGLLVSAVASSGAAWVAGTDDGAFVSPDGAAGWVRAVSDPGGVFDAKAAAGDGRMWLALNRGASSLLYFSADHGASWSGPEVELAVVLELALDGGRLWAARSDGLWWRGATLDAPAPPPASAGLGLALAGRQPVGRVARVRFALPEASDVRLDLHDATGRRVLRVLDGPRAAGAHEAALELGALGPGVYFARLTAGGRVDALRLVHLDGGTAR